MPDEAPLRRKPGGLEPEGPGWFVVNARESRWMTGVFGSFSRFEGDERFPGLGINISVLAPGQPACYYHSEDEQEDFLVLGGECLLLIEGQERRLRTWDFVHCPPWTAHVFVGSGDGPCALLAVGTRLTDSVVYPASELAARHQASVSTETRDPAEAYRGLPEDTDAPFEPGWLPDHP